MEYIIEIDYNNPQLNDPFIGLSGGVLRYCTTEALPVSEAMLVEVSPDNAQDLYSSMLSGQLYNAGSTYKQSNKIFPSYKCFSLTSTTDYAYNQLGTAKGAPVSVGDIFSHLPDNDDGKPLYKGNKFIVKNTLISDSIKTLSRAIDLKRGAGYNYTGSAEVSFFLGSTAENVPPLNGAELKVYENGWCVFTGAITKNSLAGNGVMTVTAEDSLRGMGNDVNILPVQISTETTDGAYTKEPYFQPLVLGDVEVAELHPITTIKESAYKKSSWQTSQPFSPLLPHEGSLQIGAYNEWDGVETIGSNPKISQIRFDNTKFPYMAWLIAAGIKVGDIINIEGLKKTSCVVTRVYSPPGTGIDQYDLVIEVRWLSGAVPTNLNDLCWEVDVNARYKQKPGSMFWYFTTGKLLMQPSFENCDVANITNEDGFQNKAFVENITGKTVTLLGDEKSSALTQPLRIYPKLDKIRTYQGIQFSNNELAFTDNTFDYTEDLNIEKSVFKESVNGSANWTGYTQVHFALEVETLEDNVDIYVVCDIESTAGASQGSIAPKYNDRKDIEMWTVTEGSQYSTGYSVRNFTNRNMPRRVIKDGEFPVLLTQKMEYWWKGYKGRPHGLYDTDAYSNGGGYYSPYIYNDNGYVFISKEEIQTAKKTNQKYLEVNIQANFRDGRVSNTLIYGWNVTITHSVKFLHFFSMNTESSWDKLFCTAKNANNTPALATDYMLNKIKPYINKNNYLSGTHGDWRTGRQITDRAGAIDVLSGLALQCCAKMFQERGGAMQVSYLQYDSENEWVFDDKNIVRGSVKPMGYTSVDGVYNKFNLSYHYNVRSGIFKKSSSVDKIDQAQFPIESDPTWKTFVSGVSTYATAKQIWETCRQSYIDNGVIRQAPQELQELKWINDDSVFGYSTKTIEKYLLYTAEWYAPRKAVMSFSIPLMAEYGVIELGDKCTVTDFVATQNQPMSGYVTGIKRKVKSGIIDIDAILYNVSSNTGNIVETGDAVNQIIEQGDTVNQIIEVGE